MDPTLKSIISTVAAGTAASAATWAATVGIIPASSESTITNALVALVLYVIALAIAWWKSRAHTPTALIAAVNSGVNGVKVVASSSPGAQVNMPLNR